MKVAVYARYSTDKQREASIGDQYRNCEQYAERQGWDVALRFKDEAVSGSKSDRPSYQRMIKAAMAREFEVLMVDDLSRLSRDQVESEQTIRRLEFWGIRVIAVSDGYDSTSEARKVQRGIKNLFNEVYLDDLRKKTHRGLTGQALKGNNTGGRAYGYRHVPIEDPAKVDQYGRPVVIAVTREPDPGQAEWLRRIFGWFAEGHSPRWIASELNRVGVPSPRGGKWDRSGIYGSPSKGTGILNNPLYIGRYIWNRSEWIKDPDTGIRKRRERPESEWIVQELPELRIVPQELWDRVKARQMDQDERSRKIQATLHAQARTGRAPKYLFPGLLKCGQCGSNYIMIDRYQYGCASNKNRGEHACANKAKVSRRLVEQKLLEGIKEDLFTPEAIELFRGETARLLAEKRQDREPDRLRRRLTEIEGGIENIVAAIKAGAFSPALQEELSKAEAEKQRILGRLKADDRTLEKVSDFLPRAVDRYKELAADLENVTQRDVIRARTQIKKLLGGEIKLMPTGDKHLEAELAGDYGELVRLAAGSSTSLVAGAGFEPATFGL